MIPKVNQLMNTNYISKYGYAIYKSNLEIKDIIELKTQLVARPICDVSMFGNASRDATYSVFKETKSLIYVPKMYGIEKYGFPKKIAKNFNGQDVSLEFTGGTLFPRQIEPRDSILNACYDKGGGILKIAPGSGKTVIALEVLCRLGKKTLVIVNRITLMSQWEEEITKFIPSAKIGRIQGKNVNVQGKDIVIAMLHSLSQIEYPPETFNDFGLVIVDECPNTCTKMFSQILFKICSKYSIGLSATPERSDGCEYVLKWHIGNIVYNLKEERKGNDPIILFIKMESSNYKEIKIVNRFTNRDQIQFTSMLSDLVEMKQRNDLIVNVIQQLGKKGRKILVLSERRNHIQLLYQALKDSEFTVGKFMGSMKKQELDHAKTCSVILATFSSFSEGVSVCDLDTLLLTTPKKYTDNDSLRDSNSKKDNGKMQQIIGRIFRKEHTITVPLIVDFCDNFSVYKHQTTTRKKFYKKELGSHTIVNKIVNLESTSEVNFEKLFEKKF